MLTCNPPPPTHTHTYTHIHASTCTLKQTHALVSSVTTFISHLVMTSKNSCSPSSPWPQLPPSNSNSTQHRFCSCYLTNLSITNFPTYKLTNSPTYWLINQLACYNISTWTVQETVPCCSVVAVLETCLFPEPLLTNICCIVPHSVIIV
jgi:hypothetical protein